MVILYDYMLTSDHEGFWFSIPSIHDALPPETSGAFIQRALDALIAESLVEQGGSDNAKRDLFALTEKGIRSTEELIELRGLKVEDYEPAPDADHILSRLHEPAKHESINEGIVQLRAEIEKSNSFDAELGGNGDLVQSEIEAASTLMSASRVRVSKLKALLIPALRALAKTFANQSIGELAKRLLALLLGLDN